MDNTKLWDQLCRVPPEHLKGFQRAGGFKGTAIKPMWSIHKMTEVFGPVGHGWGIDEPKFTVVPAGDEIMVYCTVAAWCKDEGARFYGVGGDKVLVKQSSGLRTDDEAFKKAYTDALTNALKLLGVGADVHMGLWDGNKYVDEKPDAPAPMQAVSGTQGASKSALRDKFNEMVKQIRDAATLRALESWFKENAAELDKLPPDWVDEMRIEFVDRKKELTNRVAA